MNQIEELAGDIYDGCPNIPPNDELDTYKAIATHLINCGWVKQTGYKPSDGKLYWSDLSNPDDWTGALPQLASEEEIVEIISDSNILLDFAQRALDWTEDYRMNKDFRTTVSRLAKALVGKVAKIERGE